MEALGAQKFMNPQTNPPKPHRIPNGFLEYY